MRLRDNLGLALRELRQRVAFAALTRGPWSVFIAIACFWQSNAEAWPSQETIAEFCGYTARAIRNHVDKLERHHLIRLRRERRPDGGERIFYAPGKVALSELAAFVERFPKERPKILRREEPERPAEERVVVPPPKAPPPEAISDTQAETISGPLPEAISGELRDQKLEEPSSLREDRPSEAHVVGKEEQVDLEGVTEEDREVARIVLTERMKRKHPSRPPPTLFDAQEIAIVAGCSSAIGGDKEAKLKANRDAIEGAYIASKDGPPTVRFIWGKLEHFLDHAERGRLKAIALERAARRRPESSSEPCAPRVLRVEQSAMSAEQMAFFRLFGEPGHAAGDEHQPARGTQ